MSILLLLAAVFLLVGALRAALYLAPFLNFIVFLLAAFVVAIVMLLGV